MIEKPITALANERLNSNDWFKVPVTLFPVARTLIACQAKKNRNLLITTWGGIGDQICAEPTIRYALKHFKDCKITIATEMPELYSHLKFHDVYNLKTERPIVEDYLVFDTIPRQRSEETLAPQFYSHMITNCVDFPAISAFRGQLPIAEREVILVPPKPESLEILDLGLNIERKYVAIHAGKHWPSKTFPTEWWNTVIESVQVHGLTPILIGKTAHDEQGFVDTTSDGCVDLRNKSSLMETIWLLQQMPVLICNDSSPLHMAVTGDAFIGFVASVKHPDFITHWRKGQWSWRMENFSLGGLWEDEHICPNKEDDLVLDKCPSDRIAKLLPDPKIFGPWARNRVDEFFRQ